MNQKLIEALICKLNQGEMKRIRHETRIDGTDCITNKEPCMNVKRVYDGLQWYCHRCKESGHIEAKNLSASATINILNKIKTPPKVAIDGEEKKIELPRDCMPLVISGQWNTNDVPHKALAWLWGVELSSAADVAKYRIMWSDYYQRVIFPIYDNLKLIGWVGRNVEKDSALPKYITRKQEGLDKRIYFKCTAADTVVFVEDILSAIKVSLCTGFSTVALLNSSLDYATVKPYKNREMLLWLDGDMKQKNMEKATRLQAFGINITSILTDKDPKEYDCEQIKEITQ